MKHESLDNDHEADETSPRQYAPTAKPGRENNKSKIKRVFCGGYITTWPTRKIQLKYELPFDFFSFACWLLLYLVNI